MKKLIFFIVARLLMSNIFAAPTPMIMEDYQSLGCKLSSRRDNIESVYVARADNINSFKICFEAQLKKFLHSSQNPDISQITNNKTHYYPLVRRNSVFNEDQYTLGARILGQTMTAFDGIQYNSSLNDLEMDMVILNLKLRINSNIERFNQLHDETKNNIHASSQDFEHTIEDFETSLKKSYKDWNKQAQTITQRLSHLPPHQRRQTLFDQAAAKAIHNGNPKPFPKGTLYRDQLSIGHYGEKQLAKQFSHVHSNLEGEIETERLKEASLTANTKRKAQRPLQLSAKFAQNNNRKKAKEYLSYARSLRLGHIIKSSDYRPLEYERVTQFSNSHEKAINDLADKYQILASNELSHIDGGQKERSKKSLDLSSEILKKADNIFFSGEYLEGEKLLDLGKSLLNTSLDFVPGVSTGKSFYEVLMGENFITGEKLSTTDRTFSAVGTGIDLLTFGAGGIIVKGSSKLVIRVFSHFNQLKGLEKVSSTLKNVLSAARKVGLKTKEGIKDFSDLSRRIVGNALFDFSQLFKGKMRRYGPMMKYSPLEDILEGTGTVADTFRSNSYFKTILDEPLKVYRVYTPNSGKGIGDYWSRVKPTGPGQVTFDAALLPSFRNNAQRVAEITIPAGTEIFEGVAAAQVIRSDGLKIKIGELLGNGSQIYFDKKKIDKETWKFTARGFFE